MCKDCGCSIVFSDHNHDAHHAHTHRHNHDDEHGHAHEHSHEYSHKHSHLENLHSNPQLNDSKTISVITKILEKNDEEAIHNREHFEKHRILSINIMSSPGSGKTTLLEKLCEVADFKFCVIEGDLETSFDADRLRAKGIEAYQIQTGSACHLDSFMVHKALHYLPLENSQVCFIENVGNLVCPASYDVGAHLNIVLLASTEGNGKVAKYPVMFRKVDLVIISKIDLIPYLDFDIEMEKKEIRRLNPKADIIEVSVKDFESLKKFAKWIKFKMEMR